MGEVAKEIPRGGSKMQKSYFDVLGICCPSEVPLIDKILKPMEGIHKVTVIVPSKTVIVEHDPHLVSQLQIVKALNQARLEATIRSYGNNKIINKWPSPYILACGILLLISLFHKLFHPLQWLALAAVALGLPPIVLRSFVAIRRFTLDINILMLIAVGGACALRDFSEAGFIVFLFTIAEWLETMASHKATAGMSALINMAPQKAIMAETGHVVDAREVKVNSILAVKAGEVVPIDGVVLEGKSEVNEQSLTGESFPVPKQPQSLVWAGTLNIDGYISVRTTALAEDSAVAKMARLVEEAQNSRSKTQRLIDSCTKYYTPVVVVIAGGVAVVPLILHVHNRKHWFQLALVLLVSACPCALVLSTPVATFCSLLSAARIGVLVKGGDVLEALASTRVVAFDKTGTITKGEFTVMDIRAINSKITMNSLLYWISSIESKSSHPMASALVDHARSNSIEPKPDKVTEFEIYPGEGVSGEIDGKKIYIGSRRIATKAESASVPNPGEEGMKEAVTRGYVFSGAELIGIFTLSDNCRTGAAEAIRQLKSLGVKTAMLTGDSTTAAMHAQNELKDAIEIVHAELLPEDKVRIINDLKTKEGPTTMVGDGMNDAPALAAANVGISMGISGSAVATETSHITLMSNDILKIPKAIRIARRTSRKIMVNIFLSVVTKIGILTLAIAGHPLLWAAVVADVGTCLVVILNSMMLLKTKAPKEKKACCRSSHASGTHKHAHKHHCGSARTSDTDRHGHADHCCSLHTSDEHHCGSHTSDTHRHGHAGHCCSPPTSDEDHCGSHNSDPHRHGHADHCSSPHTSDSHAHEHENDCSTVNHDHCCQETVVHADHHSTVNRDHCCQETTVNHDHCCQTEVTERHEDFGEAQCSDHEDHCSGSECGQSPNKGNCCQDSEIYTRSTSHKNIVTAMSREEHNCEGAHSMGEEDNIGRHVHIQCTTEHKVNGKHTQEINNVNCCNEIVAENALFIGCRKQHHGHGSNALKKCNSHTSHRGKKEISGCCRSYLRECRKRDGCCDRIELIIE